MLYHVTSKKNISSILHNGIIAGYARGFCRSSYDFKWDLVFLTDCVKYICENQLTQNFIEGGDLYVLSITDVIKNRYKCKFSNCYRPHEFVCEKVLSDKIIKVESIKDHLLNVGINKLSWHEFNECITYDPLTP